MKTAIMQPYIFPYIGYFQLINAVDKFIFYDDVNFIKSGWINRNNILVNNQKYLFTIPIEKISSYKKINAVKINQTNLKKNNVKLLKTIKLSYNKAPFFNISYNIFSSVLESNYDNISDYAKNSIKLILEYLNINTKIVFSSEVYDNQELKAEERILDICRQEKTTDYINPIGGQELYDKSNFIQKNISVNFLKTKDIKYNQFNNEFIPFLSIIDVMMFNSPEEIKIMLEKYTLI